MDTKYEQTSLLNEQNVRVQRPVECLGLTFDSDEARRAHFLAILREKLRDPEFRKIEGFPRGDDEDILALSDPPYYTVCPNPFIDDFIKYYGRSYDPDLPYSREPFAADVSEGKNDPIYNAHSYHTKVPHKAIMRYILHYTDPGDIIFDGFCGTGMTGVAAQMCSDHKVVESLGYKVLEDNSILDENGKPFSKMGTRHAFLNDLSPAATFIAHNYNTPVDVIRFEREARRIIDEVEMETGWMYATLHDPHPNQIDQAISVLNSPGFKSMAQDLGLPFGYINYTVWSDVFICPECTNEVIFWEAAVDKNVGKVRDKFLCPSCQAVLAKHSLERSWISRFDESISQTIKQAKQVPVVINYTYKKKRFDKVPDAFDIKIIDAIEGSNIPYWYPSNRLMEGGETRRNDSIGLTHVHHFYFKRTLWVLASFLQKCVGYPQVHLLFNSQLVNVSRLNRYRPGVSFPYNPLSGTLYVGSQVSEANPFIAYRNKICRLEEAYSEIRGRSVISCQSTSHISFPSNSCDYIFTDPPFGGNLAYSELNVLWEEWLRVLTDTKPEAIENKAQGKGLIKYQDLMIRCCQEYYRILKPGHWMTIEFHNSRNSVWNAIQEALQRAGFIIADVRTLDKQQGTFKQVTSGGAVKQDLIISAYKPNGGLEEHFRREAGTVEGSWDFVRIHLRQLPVFVSKDGQAEIVVERMNYLLFDRMVAFHIQRGVDVPLSASEFYAGLAQRFPERDGMYFLPDQVAEYDKKRMTVKEVLQLQLLVTDETSAIHWLRQQLTKKPQTFQDLHPLFTRELGGWQKHEKVLELSELLEQNFLRYDGLGEVPSQIHSYLSTNFKDLRNLSKDDPALHTKAKDRWYVPDPNKAIDLEKLREKALLKEFEEYKVFKGRQIKTFRLEAIRSGFKKAWQERDYQTIINVALKIPEDILQEDPKLVMWYDQALARTGNV